MALEFRIGSEDEPKGHAFLYCTYADNPNRFAASYAVILPLAMDISRYIPPFMSGLLDKMTTDMSSLVLPPVPQEVPGLDWLIEEAERRGDDLIFCGAFNFEHPENLMTAFSALMNEYKAACERPSNAPKEAIPEQAGNVDHLIYSLMPEVELLKEATTLLSEARYALEGNDATALSASEEKLRSIAKLLPENRMIIKLADVAVKDSPRSAELAALYLERAYSLYREDYLKVSELESKISDLEQEEQSAT